MKIPLIKPFVNDAVKAKVMEVLDSGYLTEGPVTHEFETVFKEFIGCSHAIAVTSCTTGLEMALRCLNIGPGDEVIVPDYTYPATAQVVAIVGAKAVIVDVEPKSMLISYEAIEKAITPKTKAIIPVSLFGNPLDYSILNRIKAQYNLHIIEDTACSIGAELSGVKVGSFADISVFSLHPRKFITTGEGGMITTNNDEWADWMNSYKHFGMGPAADREKICFLRIGTNYKLSNIQAAVGLVQMQYIDELLDRRIMLSDNYVRLLKSNPKIAFQEIIPGGKHSRQSFCIFVENRDAVMAKMREENIEVQIGTYSLHMHPAFQNNPLIEIKGDMAGSIYAFNNCLTLPLFHELTEAQQEYIVSKLLAIL